MKVLHLPHDTGGNAWHLSRAERGHGLKSDVLYKNSSSLNYPADFIVGSQRRGRFGQLFNELYTFFKVRNKYDIFHFNYGSSLIHHPRFRLLNQLDLPFYPKSKKLFVTYNGCDARQKFPTMQRRKIAACFSPGCYQGMCNSGRLDEIRRWGIEKMSQYVNHMWALNPDLLHFLPREKASFLPYPMKRLSPVLFPPKKEGVLQIVHAPTNRVVKGSSFILEAVEQVKKKYPGTIEFTTIEHLSHQDALIAYQKADLVIDQVLVGWYGAFAVENMLMGKPVMAWICLEDLVFIQEEMKKDLLDAMITVEASSIENKMIYFIENRKALIEKGEACLAYAKKWHSPTYVGNLTKEMYER